MGRPTGMLVNVKWMGLVLRVGRGIFPTMRRVG